MTWILQLNDMRYPKSEYLKPVCRADTAEEILALIERETVPTYRDGHWQKSFRAGGPLEWFNPPYDTDIDYLRQREVLIELTDIEVAVARYREQLTRELAQIPHVGLVTHGEEVRERELTAGL